MSGELENGLEQLRLAFDSGLLDEDTYHAAVARLEAAKESISVSGDVEVPVIEGERNIGGDVGHGRSHH